MANRKIRTAAAGSPRKGNERRRSAGGGSDAREGDALVEATHQVIEDEIRRGDVPAAPDPDQKGEPGSRV
jgi:hypothetical protein